MAFITFKQYSSFFFILAIFAVLNAANSLSPNKNESVDPSGLTYRKGDDAPTRPGTSNTNHGVQDNDAESGPSPGEGHGVLSPAGTSNGTLEEDTDAESGPSPGEGHGVPSLIRTSSAIHNQESTDDESRPSPGKGHGVPSIPKTNSAIDIEEGTGNVSGPSPGEGHAMPSPSGGL